MHPEAGQPPFCMRSSSARPLSNSWLPTDAKSTCMRFIASIAGSLANSWLTSGAAPMPSPAITVNACSPYTACLSFNALPR